MYKQRTIRHVLFLILTMLSTSPTLTAQVGQKYTRPPQDQAPWTKESISAIAEKIRKQVNKDLPIKLLSTEEWADYRINHHYVSETAEGRAEGTKLDYNWVADETPRRGLASAEVTETGEFNLWWERCNYYGWNETQCENFLIAVINHENGHYEQWQRLALNVLAVLGFIEIGTDVLAHHLPQIPRTLDDLKQFPEAEEAFMKIWADPAHYQCREVEVYTTQFLNGQITKERLGEQDFKYRVQKLALYTYGKTDLKGCPGCINSIWANEFRRFLNQAESILAENGVPNPHSAK